MERLSDFDPDRRFRLEPLPRSDEVATGLSARVHDPAWLLTRQWQLGEFLGQDAGSPVVVTLAGRSRPITAWRPRPGAEDGSGPSEPPAWRPYRVDRGPLDPRVEAEPPAPAGLAGGRRRLRIDGGARLLRLLREAGREVLIPTLLAECGFEPDEEFDGVAGGVAALLAAEVPDAARVARRLASGEALGGDLAKPVLAAWSAWWEQVTDDGPKVVAYDEHRLEHRFELACGEVVLQADEHNALGLDWWSVDAVDAGSVPGVAAPGGEAFRFSREGLATPVRYGGLPADRFWEMEDAQVDLSATEVSTLDLGRMLMIGFAEVYGNDWFMVPVEVPVGSITRLDDLVVTDTFGDTVTIGPAGRHDSGWNLFAVTGTEGLLVMPSMVGQTGPELERVVLARDELANTAWAVERTYTDGVGRLVDRREESLRGRGRRDALPEPGEVPAYVVQTEVPPYWLPLLPVPISADSIRFHLARLLQTDAEDAEPRGLLVHPGQWLHEEEVPREGVVLTRRAALSRWYDGSWHAWTRREKDAGAGESSSGLAFDVVRPSDPWP